MNKAHENRKARLDGVALNVTSPERLAAFYTSHLGMSLTQDGDFFRLSYPGMGACLELRPSPSPEAYNHDASDEYWKIGITLPNIDIAFQQLKRGGITVTEPRQFQDIGYMCHLADPEGFNIELLQHTFEGQPRTSEGDLRLPLGGGGQIGQITLRVADIDRALSFYQEKMGMRLLSKQRVGNRGFDLYFLAFTSEQPPHSDLEAVENRPWLWQRQYTTLELQHHLEPGHDIMPTIEGATGLNRLLFQDS